MIKRTAQRFLKGCKAITLAATGLTLAVGALASNAALAKERFALVIANKDYKHTGPVRFAFRDAAAIEKALINTMGVPQQNIVVEKNLSKGALEYWFGTENEPGQLASRVSDKDSEIIVYFAGHGSKFDAEDLEKPIPFLLGTDTRPQALRRTGYSLDTLKANLRKIKTDQLPQGRVTLILESCFSGSYNDGDLLTGVSAPAFGRPTKVISATEEKLDNFVVLAAAQGDQFAVWDNQWERSVFTDALVSGLYGEADDKRFDGNSDGVVTLSELQGFVSKRIDRRLRATGVNSRQDPVINGSAELALVNTKETDGVWPAMIERSGKEKLEADILEASKDVAGIEEYLSNCLYCYNQAALKSIVREVQQQASICTIEERWLANVSGPTAGRKLKAFLKTSRCKSLRSKAERMARKAERAERRAELKERRELALAAKLSRAERRKAEAEIRAEERELARLERDEARKQLEDLKAEKVKKTVSLNTTQTDATPAKPVDASDVENRFLLARRLQTELKRVGCLYGRVDGIWGRGSDRALDRFVKLAGVDVVGAVPSEDAIDVVASVDATVCKARPSTVVKKPRAKKRKKKSKVVYEVIDETPKKKRRSKKKKSTVVVKKSRKRTKTTYSAPKKTYRKKKTYSGGSITIGSGGGSEVKIDRQCSRYGTFC